MNKTHRIVWSAARQAYIVAHEHATACGKPASTRAAAVVLAGLLAAATPALATPVPTCSEWGGESVVTGSATSSCVVFGSYDGSVNITVNEGASIDVSASSDGGDAIYVESSDTGGGTVVKAINNKGSLITGAGWNNSGGSAGIKVSGHVAVSGDITHSGTINTETNPGDDLERHGIAIVSANPVTFYAFNPVNQVGSPVIEGQVKVEKTGVIHAWNGGDGIHVKGDRSDNSQLQIKGGIDNAGTIYAEGEGAAIRVNDATVGHINNSGQLITYAAGDPGLAGDQGLYVGSSIVSHHITNAAGGKINSNYAGVEIYGSTLGGGKDGDGVFNRGEINSVNGTAILVSNSTIKGDILNEGTLSAYSSGYSLSKTTVEGAFENKNTITTTDGEGIVVSKSTIKGVVRNSGTIQAGEPGGGGDNNSGYYIQDSTLKGGLENTGTILANEDGIRFEGSVVEKGQAGNAISNAGSISAGEIGIGILGAGIWDGDDYVGEKPSLVNGNIVNGGDIYAGEYGIYIDQSEVTGDVVNHGSIIAGDTENFEDNSDSDGIHVAASTINGRLTNSGSIRAQDDAIMLSGDDIAAKLTGSLINFKTGTLTANDDAVDIDGAEIGGEIRNEGTIVAGDSGYEIERLKLTGNLINTGTITAKDDGLDIADSVISGAIVNNGIIVADYKAIALYEGTTAAGVTIAGIGSKPAVLDGKQFALFAQGQTENELPLGRGAMPVASFGGIALAGSTRIVGDIYAQADALTVKGADNRISGAIDVKQLTVESGGVLVLDSLASSSKAWIAAHPDADDLPTLADALKTSDGTHNHGRLVLAKAESYQIIGDYHQTTDATLSVRATGDKTYSQLKVEGMAALDSGTKIDVDVRQDSEIAAGATSSNTLFTTNRLAGVIQATNLVSDGKFSVSDNSALFDFSAEIDKNNLNNVDLVLKKLVTIEQVVKDNKGSVPLASQDAARVLDKIADRLVANGNAGAMAPVIDALGKLGTDTGLAQAVEQLTPALPSAALSAVSDSLGAINRVVQARVEGNIGLSSGDEPSAERYVWVKPFGSYAKQDARSETSGFKANTGGLVFGADAAISPKLRLGAALAYAHSDVDGKSASAPQSSKVDVYQLIGYGSVQLDARTELNFQLDAGRNRNQGERQLSFMGVKASSDYDSLSYHMGAGIGRTFALPREITTTPSLRVDYTRIKEDGYSETGAGAANLINGKRSVEQTLLAVDNRFMLPLNARQSASLNAGAAYDLMNDGAVLTSAFAGESSALFSTESSGQSRWLWRAGIGHTYKADTGKGGLELSTRLDGEWRKGGYSNATASVKARYAF
ncbi:autotransporter domain-containing protein [Craterilacuibacter sinensis]|nr:autotransporter domain-containing protein [Craterilacuibacter sinensis]